MARSREYMCLADHDGGGGDERDRNRMRAPTTARSNPSTWAPVIAMALKMRPTGLGHGVYKDNVDFGVFCGDWCIGRIYETRTGPADLRWFWALYAPSKPGTLRTDSRAATLAQAKAEFEASWKQ